MLFIPLAPAFTSAPAPTPDPAEVERDRDREIYDNELSESDCAAAITPSHVPLLLTSLSAERDSSAWGPAESCSS